MIILPRILASEILEALARLAPAMGLGSPSHQETNDYHVWRFNRAGVMLIYEPDEALPWRVQSTMSTTPSAIGSTDPEPERRRCASFDEAVEELGRAHAITLLLHWRNKDRLWTGFVPYPPDTGDTTF